MSAGFFVIVKIKSGQMVLEKVKWAYSYVYLSQTMENHAKSSMKRLKQPTSVF